MAQGKIATVTLNPQHQNAETIQAMLKQILHIAGCGACGRMAYLRVDFIGDPPPEMAKAGAISFHTEGM